MHKKVYIETYGCQMNVADSEVVVSILSDSGYESTDIINDAELILINTCSIRDNAEQRIWGRLTAISHLKKRKKDLKIGIIGCMAERLKEKLIEKDQLVDIVVGPDAYRELPLLIAEAEAGHKAVNVLLSREETYADISPVRMDKNGVSSFVSIMRGCNNMCSYCVVPYVRGAERSRDQESVLREVTKKLHCLDKMLIPINGQRMTKFLTFPNFLQKLPWKILQCGSGFLLHIRKIFQINYLKQ
jgi:tRNA-2-methylthio-N6-dimethylallyladenosine synthase